MPGGMSNLLIVLDLHEHGKFVRRFVSEIQTYGRLYRSVFPEGCKVDVEHEIVAGIQSPSDAVRLDWRAAAGLPEQENQLSGSKVSV